MKTKTILAMHEMRLMTTQVIAPIALVAGAAIYWLNATPGGKEFKNEVKNKIETRKAKRIIKKAIKQQKKTEKKGRQ